MCYHPATAGPTAKIRIKSGLPNISNYDNQKMVKTDSFQGLISSRPLRAEENAVRIFYAYH